MIKTLDRITLRGLEDKDTINVVRYNNELYCIDDPLLLDKAKDYRVIAEVNNQKELWKYYIENNVRNCLDPFKLLLLYKAGVITKDIIPEKIHKILEYAKDIDNSILEELEKYVREQEANRPILLHITILVAIKDIIKRLKEKGIELNAKDLIHDITDSVVDIVHIPNPLGLKSLVEEIIRTEEEKARKREWKEYKERRDSYIAEQMKGSKANIVVIEENKDKEDKEDTDKIKEDIEEVREGYEPIEEKRFSKVEFKIILLYPEEQRDRVMKFIEKIKNATSKFCRKNGIEIGEL